MRSLERSSAPWREPTRARFEVAPGVICSAATICPSRVVALGRYALPRMCSPLQRLSGGQPGRSVADLQDLTVEQAARGPRVRRGVGRRARLGNSERATPPPCAAGAKVCVCAWLLAIAVLRAKALRGMRVRLLSGRAALFAALCSIVLLAVRRRLAFVGFRKCLEQDFARSTQHVVHMSNAQTQTAEVRAVEAETQTLEAQKPNSSGQTLAAQTQTYSTDISPPVDGLLVQMDHVAHEGACECPLLEAPVPVERRPVTAAARRRERRQRMRGAQNESGGADLVLSDD